MIPEQLVNLFTDISATTNAIKARAPMIAGDAARRRRRCRGRHFHHRLRPQGPAHDGGGRQGARHRTCRWSSAPRECFEEASRSGWGPRDGAAVAVYWSSAQEIATVLRYNVHHLVSGVIMQSLTLAQASTIVDVALKTGRDNKFLPLVGRGARCRRASRRLQARGQVGHPALRHRVRKAWGALGMGLGSRTLAERAAKHAAVLHHAGGGERGPHGAAIRPAC